MSSAQIIDQDALTVEMPKRELGKMGWQASLLTLGGVKWDTRISETEAVELIHRALELGVNTFDTAAGYGGGQSEERLGLALEGQRDRVWVETKTGDRDYDGAKRSVETSLKRLRTDRIDLLFVHGVDNDNDCEKALSPDGVLKALEEYRAAGNIRYIGVSGHWYKQNMKRFVEAYPVDAALFPAGYFNIAYDYSYLDDVLPAIRKRGAAALGMKIFAAGRVGHAVSIEPYLRYSVNLPIDTLVIGCDSIQQLEEMVSVIKREPDPLSEAEMDALKPEAIHVTQEFESGEFNWVSHYKK